MLAERNRARDFDWWLLLIVIAICGLGVIDIYFATHTGDLAGMHWRQLAWIGLGLACMLVMSVIDYHKILDNAPLLFILGIASLVLVLFVGKTRFGSKSWLDLRLFDLQVAEPMKLIIIVVLARFFSEVRTDRLSLLDLTKAGVLLGIPVGLILMQPDFGTAMMFVPALLVGLFLAGIQ